MAQGGFKFTALQPSLPECWDYKYAPFWLTYNHSKFHFSVVAVSSLCYATDTVYPLWWLGLLALLQLASIVWLVFFFLRPDNKYSKQSSYLGYLLFSLQLIKCENNLTCSYITDWKLYLACGFYLSAFRINKI